MSAPSPDITTLLERSQAIINRASTLEVRHTEMNTLLHNLDTRVARAEQDHTDAVEHSVVLGEAIEGAKEVIAQLSEHGLANLKRLVTDGLQAIFDGCNYSLDIEISDRGTLKTADLILVETFASGEVRRTNLQDNGWGIRTMVSLILRVYFICQLGLRRFLILDESMVQLSKEYIDGLFTFLRSLHTDLGFDILCVTHDPRFLPYGDSVYEMNQGKLACVRKVKGGTE